jgi:hypothetical protein
MKNNKSFDCLDMKLRAQEQIYKEIKGMSITEELKYWKKRERSFRQERPATKKGASRKQNTVESL